MRTYDLSPLMRSTIGFDRMARLLDQATRLDEATANWPPYNIEKRDEDSYRITMAVAGFGEDDLEITAQDNSLVVKGNTRETEEGVEFLHRGIAGRSFERRFQLAEHIVVDGAGLENGLLHINLRLEVPEAKKPRTIEITKGAGATVLEGPKGSGSNSAKAA